MAFTTPKTWSTGETITDSDLNTYVRDNTDFLHDPPRVNVTHSTVQSISDSSWTALEFDTEAYDTDGMHSNVTNNTRITIQTAGTYVLAGQCSLAAASTKNSIALRFRRNGSVSQGQQGPLRMAQESGLRSGMNISSVRQLGAGDFIEMEVWQNTGGALDTVQEVGTPFIQACWVATV